jgi:small subunit ribosomal protein S3e
MFTQNISKKRKFIKQGMFYAEINEFLRRMLAEDGYAGVQIKPTPQATQVVIRCTKTNEVVAKIPYIQKLLQLRWKFDKEENIKVFAEKVQPRGLSARAQAQSICYKLKGGLAVRRACYGVLKFIMDNGAAKGVQIIISGKLRGARAKAMKFKEGYMICSGHAKNAYITEAVEHVLLRQGTIGVRVTIMLPHDPEGKNGGVKENLPDIVTVHKPQDYEKDKEFEPFRAEEQGMAQPQPQAQPLGQPVTAGYGAAQQEPAPQVYQASGFGQQYGQTPGGPDQRQPVYQNQGQYNPQGYAANQI